MTKEHLEPWQPGQSGNPAGRPKGVRDTKTILKELFELDVNITDIEGVPKKVKAIDAMHLMQLKKAIKEKDSKAYNSIMERYEGKPKQEIDTTHTFQKMPKIEVDGKEMDFNVGQD